MPAQLLFAILLLTTTFESILDFFSKGGWFMLPLVVCSLVAATVGLLKAIALRREMVLPKVVEGEIERLQPGDRPENLRQMVHQDPAALSVLANVALSHLHVSRAENSEAVQTRARREIMRLEGGLAVLETIVGISPLLGLLGAVSGLVNLFSNFGGAGKTASQSNVAVAAGIAEALNTTIVGLAIAIPTLIVYTYFSKRVEAMAVELESLMADLLSKCYHRKAAARPAGTAASANPGVTEPAATTGTPAISPAAFYAPRARALAIAAAPELADEPHSGVEPA